MRRHLLPITLLALALPAAAQKDRDWPTFGLDHANTRLADLPAITPKTVKKLVPKWIYQSGVAATFQATPIVTGGRMYVSLPGSHVVALDARTGAELWRYTHRKRTDKLCCGPANRGVAVDDGRVFVATVDARLVALDAATGKPAWDIELARPDSALTESGEGIKGEVGGGSGVGAAAAPLVVDGKVIVGINGVGYGLHIDAQGRAELAHRRVLGLLGLSPLLDLELRLGEGSGAVLAVSLVQSAVHCMREMRTFEEANLVRPRDPRDAASEG